MPNDVYDKLLTMRKGKAEICLNQLKNWGVDVQGNRFNFASFSKKGHYWMEPSKQVLLEDWTFVLFDESLKKLYQFNIPQNTFTYEVGKSNSLKIRADKPDLIKLEIKKTPYIDKQSNQDFSNFLVAEITFIVR